MTLVIPPATSVSYLPATPAECRLLRRAGVCIADSPIGGFAPMRWRPFSFELSLAAILVAVLSLTLILIAVLVATLPWPLPH